MVGLRCGAAGDSKVPSSKYLDLQGEVGRYLALGKARKGKVTNCTHIPVTGSSAREDSCFTTKNGKKNQGRFGSSLLCYTCVEYGRGKKEIGVKLCRRYLNQSRSHGFDETTDDDARRMAGRRGLTPAAGTTRGELTEGEDGPV